MVHGTFTNSPRNRVVPECTLMIESAEGEISCSVSQGEDSVDVNMRKR